MKPKVYLDTCSLQRPLDSKTHIRVALEADAILGILNLIESGRIELVSSEVLLFEIGRNPNSIRQEYALEVMSKAETYVAIHSGIEKRAKEFVLSGISPLDALHLASAEDAPADYLCTCDDTFLKKAKAVSGLKMKIVSPLELVEEIEK